jgi:hypothetical protein
MMFCTGELLAGDSIGFLLERIDRHPLERLNERTSQQPRTFNNT